MDLEAMGFDFTDGLDCPSSLEDSKVLDCSDIIKELEQASIGGDLSVIKLTFATLRSIPECDIYLERPGSSPLSCYREQARQDIATINKDVSLLEVFLYYGWDITEQLDWAAPPALELAIEDERITSWFLAHGADPNSTCQSGLTPLSAAVEYATFNIIKLLLNYDGSVKGKNLIHHAARREADDRLDVLDYILERGGRANINCIIYDDEPIRYKLQEAFRLGTPLHGAASHRHIEIVRTLVENGADPQIKDSYGQTVTQRAKWWKQVQIVEYLQSLGFLE